MCGCGQGGDPRFAREAKVVVRKIQQARNPPKARTELCATKYARNKVVGGFPEVV